MGLPSECLPLFLKRWLWKAATGVCSARGVVFSEPASAAPFFCRSSPLLALNLLRPQLPLAFLGVSLPSSSAPALSAFLNSFACFASALCVLLRSSAASSRSSSMECVFACVRFALWL